MKTTLWILSILTLSFTLSSCEKDDNEPEPTPPETGDLSLSLSGLEDLGSDYRYEGWLIVNGSPVSTGVFSVDGTGTLSQTSFSISQSNIDAASTFVLTIEPSPDPDPSPSSVHVLAGDFSADNAGLTVSHSAALGSDFSQGTGGYILATPTDGMMNNENSGVWFLDPAAGPGAGLDLPVLPEGWAYEGWAVINGVPVSSGTFTALDEMDASAPFSSDMPGPPFPGEDFLENAPSGLTFPLDLSGGTVVISIEPVPDNSPAPFTLKPLAGMVPDNAIDHTFYTMENNASNSFPSGTAIR